MKKLTKKYKCWLINRSRNEIKRSLESRRKSREKRRTRSLKRSETVQAWSGEGTVYLKCTDGRKNPPKIICFESNMPETASFFNSLGSSLSVKVGSKKASWSLTESKKKKGIGRLKTFYDFSKISYMSTAAAVVLTAIYDRARRLIGSAPPTINLHEWSNAAFNTLFEIGFFEVVGITPQAEERYADYSGGNTRTMTMISGANSTELEEASKAIIELSHFIDTDGLLPQDISSALNSAIGEAMVNVANHAYPPSFISQNRQVNRWWISASADKRNRTLNVVIYDQGASIPWTLPKRPWAAKFLDAATLSWARGEYEYDADYIEFAMGMGRSATGEKNRGQGLPQMRDFVDLCESGSLTILSRGGKCCYMHQESLVKELLTVPIEGTLIEWKMSFPAVS